jgi:hypothetical protein
MFYFLTLQQLPQRLLYAAATFDLAAIVEFSMMGRSGERQWTRIVGRPKVSLLLSWLAV